MLLAMLNRAKAQRIIPRYHLEGVPVPQVVHDDEPDRGRIWSSASSWGQRSARTRPSKPPGTRKLRRRRRTAAFGRLRGESTKANDARLFDFGDFGAHNARVELLSSASLTCCADIFESFLFRG